MTCPSYLELARHDAAGSPAGALGTHAAGCAACTTTLRELARLKPATPDALRHVYGVGARKAEDLGMAVLQTIAAHQGSGVGTPPNGG